MNKKIILLILMIVLAGAVYGSMSSSSINWLSKGQADSLYCKVADGCTSSSSSSGNSFEIFFNHSIKTNIHFYINESDASEINTYTTDGKKFIFGGEFT